MSVVPLAKQKTCRVCREKFRPWATTLQRVCSVKCAVEDGRIRAQKEIERIQRVERARRREQKRKLMTVRDWTKLCQAAFNGFVRERDEGLPCISCGARPGDTSLRGHKMDCGHYRSMGAAPHLRFTEDNAAAQCVKCNRDLSGNTVAFRRGLIERIGVERVEALESDNSVRRWTVDELEELTKAYRAKTRELRKARGAC